MALSVVDLYRDVLPKTNCGDCGFTTCLAFASQVVSEKLDLGLCPHVPADLLEQSKAELAEQYREGRWTKRDMAADALQWVGPPESGVHGVAGPARPHWRSPGTA